MLKEASANWWWGARARFSAIGTPLDWENFQRAFLDRYFTETIREQKYREYRHLQQDDLSDEEYLTKFEELDRYASHADYPMDETRKINQFQWGLRNDIKKTLLQVNFTIFDTLVDRSYGIEAHLREMEVERQKKWFNNKNEGKHSQKKQRADIRGNANMY